MEITFKNYQEIKEQLAAFERRQEAILKAKKEKEKLLQSNENVFRDLPRNMGGLEYVTKVDIRIAYNSATANYQGEVSRVKEFTLPNDLYEFVFDKECVKAAIEKKFEKYKPYFDEIGDCDEVE